MPNGDPAAPLLIDTHVWFWVVEGVPDRLSAETLSEIDTAALAGRLLVSAISVWEISMLESRGRISFKRPLTEWVDLALHEPGVRLLDLSPEIAIESNRLPGAPHGDPADRILMASARVTGARLATCDAAILAYARTGHLAVLDARP
jgi:PIN domain nuclease of toxin-antitoxin system